jgi:RNA polymerase sigma factor (sigma-70 family)
LPDSIPRMNVPDLAALRAGDKDAWEDAFRWLWPTALAVAKEKLAWARPQDVEDVAIDAMEMLVEKANDVKSVLELKPLLATISYRRAISRLRWHYGPGGGSQTQSSDAVESDATRPSEEPSGSSPAEEMEQKELGDLLRRLQVDLKPQLREIMNDFFITGLSYIEIAQKHSIAVGSVGVCLKRGLERLRQLLEKKPALLKETRDALRLSFWIVITFTLK